MSEHLGGAGLPALGEPAPTFRLQSIDGRTVALTDFRPRRIVLWLSRGIFCTLCRVALSQLRYNYPAFRARNADLVEVGPNLPKNALRGFRQYLGERDLEFPYLCDPDFAVHHRYGLRNVAPGEALRTNAASLLSHLTTRPFVTPDLGEVGRLLIHPIEQAIFVVDGEGFIRYRYVTAPAGKLPSPAELLQALDDLPV